MHALVLLLLVLMLLLWLLMREELLVEARARWIHHVLLMLLLLLKWQHTGCGGGSGTLKVVKICCKTSQIDTALVLGTVNRPNLSNPMNLRC